MCNGAVSSDNQRPPVDQAPAAAAQADPVVIAWQPITPAGVARFAKASFANVLLIELLISSFATAAVFWFLYTTWFPGIRQAIRQLPENGSIRGGALIWPGDAASTVLETRFLGVAVDPNSTGAITLASDVRVHFQRDRAKVCSLFGCAFYPYPTRYIIELNRPEAEPWWGAWQPILLGFVTVGVPLLLLFVSAVLATLYCPIARLIAFFADRDLNWAGSWRLAAAALMPGTILLSSGIVAYGLSTIDLVRFLTLVGLYVIAGWIYVVASPFFLPRISRSFPLRKNPFANGLDRKETK